MSKHFIINFMFQLTFTMDNYLIDKSVMPKSIPSGLFIIETIIELNDDIVAGMQVIIRTEADPTDF